MQILLTCDGMMYLLTLLTCLLVKDVSKVYTGRRS